jgi:hypothetical protein
VGGRVWRRLYADTRQSARIARTRLAAAELVATLLIHWNLVFYWRINAHEYPRATRVDYQLINVTESTGGGEGLKKCHTHEYQMN